MRGNKKQYWKGIEQLSNDTEFVKHADKEFPDYLPINEGKQNGNAESGSSRRDFLKMMGFGIAAVTLASCEAPVRKAIPYLNKPVDVDPGIPNFYASTYAQEGDYCSIVIKTREGRPIKIEGNRLSTVTQGGKTAQVEASVLSLYDKQRLTSPYIKGQPTDWATLDQNVASQLSNISSQGGQIRIVSNTILSPTTKRVIEDFQSRFPTTQHITYDSKSAYGITLANQQSFGEAIIPSYDFSRANVIVSFAADFLGTWISPIEYTKQYSKTRKLNKDKRNMSRHYQFETTLSVTGANADYRTPIKPSQEGLAVTALYNLLAKRAGIVSAGATQVTIPHLEMAAEDLWNSRGGSLVVSGSNDVSMQLMINAINNLLGNYGTTINTAIPVYYKQGNDRAMTAFVNDVEAGRINAVIFFNANPVYDYALGEKLSAGLSKVQFKLATNDRMDETASLADYVAPDHHYLESWNDAEPKRGHFSLAQPGITPIFNTRQAPESLLVWSGNPETSYYNYLLNSWRNQQFAAQTLVMDFQTFWDRTLHDGVLVAPGLDALATTGGTAFAGNIASAVQNINNTYKPANEGIELVLYQKVGIGTGAMANNPWLQEMPDPISKSTWDNYLTVSQSMARDLGIEYGEGQTSMVNFTANDRTYKLPVLVQPGQAPDTVGLALGYGRTKAGKVGDNVGVNAYPLIMNENGVNHYAITSGVQVEAISEMFKVAQTQTHETYMGRDFVIQESILPEYQENPRAGRYEPQIATSKGMMDPESVSLWHGHKYPNHHWGMVIDLNSCTGCGTCTIACQAENNIPVVGKDEVLNRREMHWLRIDRYYSSKSVGSYQEMEVAAENPEVVFQPMLCQQCNNAPCETVCPVAATTHSTEGLNQMTYNRCIGTRYCANNCPYKVRRFNWFKYHDNKNFAEVNVAMNTDLGKMVLNPDVTVRSRGVMEKCTFCVQRIQAGKLEAKKEGRRPVDGEIVTACASACPADAIIFGDLNDENSNVVKIATEQINERAYHVLEELNVKPNIYYLTKIRNKVKEENNA